MTNYSKTSRRRTRGRGRGRGRGRTLRGGQADPFYRGIIVLGGRKRTLRGGQDTGRPIMQLGHELILTGGQAAGGRKRTLRGGQVTSITGR